MPSRVLSGAQQQEDVGSGDRVPGSSVGASLTICTGKSPLCAFGPSPVGRVQWCPALWLPVRISDCALEIILRGFPRRGHREKLEDGVAW